jgi:sterol-4alpha-carboxylate 3-dehydrogenase (decarboxylating)
MPPSDAQFLGTVLVTGGAGIVGSFVIEELIKDPSCKKVIATYHSQKAQQHSCPEVDYHVCDVTDSTAIQSLLNKTQPTVIIHTVSPEAFAPADLQHRVNYIATKEWVRQAKQHPTVQAFVYTSSAEAVAVRSGKQTEPIREEEAQLNDLNSKTGLSAYGKTKGAADALVLAANTGPKPPNKEINYCGQLFTTTLRVAGLHGKRDLTTIYEMLKCVNTPATRFQIGPDAVTHEWVYTSNVAQAHLLAAKALLDRFHTSTDMRVDGEAFFVTDDSPMRFWEFSRKVWIAAGDEYLTGPNKPRIVQIPFWIVIMAVSAGESIRKFLNTGAHELKLSRHHLEYMRAGCRLSVEKAKTRLGYQPVCNTDEGIKASVSWFQDKENKAWINR